MTTATGSLDHVTITLGRAEALTLFEMLARQEEALCPGSTAFRVEYPAEAVALSQLLCLLDKQMTEPFVQDGSYSKLVDQARSELLKRFGDA